MRISNEKYLPTNDTLPPFSQWENMRIYAQSHRGASKTNNHRALNELIVNASASVASVLSKWWMGMEYRQCSNSSCSSSIISSNRRTSTARPWIVSHAYGFISLVIFTMYIALLYVQGTTTIDVFEWLTKRSGSSSTNRIKDHNQTEMRAKLHDPSPPLLDMLAVPIRAHLTRKVCKRRR